MDDEAVNLIPGIYTRVRLGGKRDADNKTQWSYLLRYFNHSIVHLFFSSVKRSFNNYVDKKRSVESPHVTKGRYHVKFNNFPLQWEGVKIRQYLVHVVVE